MGEIEGFFIGMIAGALFVLLIVALGTWNTVSVHEETLNGICVEIYGDKYEYYTIESKNIVCKEINKTVFIEKKGAVLR